MIRFLFNIDGNSAKPELSYFIKDSCIMPREVMYQTHFVAEFMYVINGHGVADINGVKRNVTARDFYIVNPYTKHGECILDDMPFDYYIVGVKNFFLPPDTADEFALLKTLDPNEDIVFLLNKIFKEQVEQQADYQKATKNYFSLLITAIERRFSHKVVPLPVVPDNMAGSARAFIESNFSANISGKIIAQHLNVSLNTLERKFKKTIGKSMQQYILERRILCAKETLERNNVPTMQLANLVGFDNSAYFCKYFKKVMGKSPKQYQKEFMNKEKK